MTCDTFHELRNRSGDDTDGMLHTSAEIAAMANHVAACSECKAFMIIVCIVQRNRMTREQRQEYERRGLEVAHRVYADPEAKLNVPGGTDAKTHAQGSRSRIG